MVSIPQSGFGAFERPPERISRNHQVLFQSLSRDSGRLNHGEGDPRVRDSQAVSIHQSGFGAFELVCML